MTISKENKRVIITVPKTLHDKIKDKADAENRSVSNYIITLVKKVIEDK